MLVPKVRNAVTPTPVQLAKILLVEGDTPAHFFEALAKHVALEDAIEIRNCGGITQLASFLGALASTEDFKLRVKSLGIVRDAEVSYQSAMDSITAALTNAQLQSDIAVSCYLFPDNRNPWMIETVCAQAVMKVPVFECGRKFIDCAKDVGAKLPAGIRLSKHVVQAYLSVMEDVQMMPGLAAYDDAWNFSDAVWDDLKGFLRKL